MREKRLVTFDLGRFSTISICSHNTVIILSKHIIAALIHILLSMSVFIKGEVAVERYHTHWLQIGGLNNQAKIKGRLCFRVSPFAWIRLETRVAWMWQLDIPPVKNPSFFLKQLS